ncbi:NACHT domain-containing protein [Pseudanabaena mucicola]|uniref:NACHT domain-containing protein n=1 Tax=Pseudanabaena mucicola FACHB-723 TaxID=2692860 RepID=A0ABR7ZYL6_9CYAN|nr:NACHT domain-containing protein [Pseudanabaena mucicola]MBD2188356.1 NACHT domain-containing protein [Pseudanabaena mucicola FACHB-723]
MDTKRDQSIDGFVKRFELALSGFLESSRNQGRELDVKLFQQNVFKAASNYRRNYLKSHGFIQIFGSRKLSTLSSIYIPQRLQAHTSIRNFDSVDELEEAFSRDLQRGSHTKGNNLLGLNVANEEEYLTVLGEPATGKTTFLKYIGLEALRHPEGRYKHNLIPVFIPMWKFCHDSYTLLAAIAEEFARSGFPDPQGIAKWLLAQGKLLILIDGLNEATTKQKELSSNLRDFVKSYPKNRYIVSSRLISYQNSLGQFLELALQPWSDLLIQEYIHKWFTLLYQGKDGLPSEIETVDDDTLDFGQLDQASLKAQQCWQALQSNPIAKELANSPLRLSLLCLLHDRRYSFPSHGSGLYQKAINLVLEEQVVKCQALNLQAGNLLTTDILELFLTEIAHQSFETKRTHLPLAEVTENLQVLLSNCKKHLRGLDLDFALKVLQQVELCNLNTLASATDSKGNAVPNFIFSHITFQEYFVARYIYHHHKIEDTVTNYLSDRRWQQVFLLLGGMMLGNVESLLLSIEARAAKYICTSKLMGMLDWLEQISCQSKGDIRHVAKRIAALFIARPRFLAELAPAMGLTNMLSIARALYGMFEEPLDFDHIFATDISMSLAHALDFDSTTEVHLTIQLAQNLEQALSKMNFDERYINFSALVARLELLISQAPSYDQPYEIRENFRQQINQVWLKTLYLPMELNQISHQEVEALENYLYANLLMVQCRNIAIAVPTKIWDKIESRILGLSPDPDIS